jgi:hypothetical protein
VFVYCPVCNTIFECKNGEELLLILLYDLLTRWPNDNRITANKFQYNGSPYTQKLKSPSKTTQQMADDDLHRPE